MAHSPSWWAPHLRPANGARNGPGGTRGRSFAGVPGFLDRVVELIRLDVYRSLDTPGRLDERLAQQVGPEDIRGALQDVQRNRDRWFSPSARHPDDPPLGVPADSADQRRQSARS